MTVSEEDAKMDGMTTTSDDVAAQLRSWARGMYTTEAGVELLIRSGRVYAGAPWLHAEDTRVSVDVDELLVSAGVLSGGERRLVEIAASLLSKDHPVDLGNAIAGIDRHGVELVLAALAHANGSHEHSGFAYDDEGTPTGIVRHTTLFAWPTAMNH